MNRQKTSKLDQNGIFFLTEKKSKIIKWTVFELQKNIPPKKVPKIDKNKSKKLRM